MRAILATIGMAYALAFIAHGCTITTRERYPSYPTPCYRHDGTQNELLPDNVADACYTICEFMNCGVE